jgi:uncharacterized protein
LSPIMYDIIAVNVKKSDAVSNIKRAIEMVIKSEVELNVEKLKKELLPILKRHQVSRAGVFGSVAEGTSRETSDIDFLVEFKGEKSLLDLVALKLDLESRVNRKIDILTYKALNPLIKKKVLSQEVRLL